MRVSLDCPPVYTLSTPSCQLDERINSAAVLNVIHMLFISLDIEQTT
jgi:hypothetical protein